jgi:hypothetical protein
MSPAEAALNASGLLEAYELYRRGFLANLDSFYPGLNALSLLSITIELAKKLPNIWQGMDDSEAKAALALSDFEIQRHNLAGAVRVALDAAEQRLKQSGQEDRWVSISGADHLFLTNSNKTRVALAYRAALAGATDFEESSAKQQLELFQRLGLFEENTQAALGEFREIRPELPLGWVILFTGHMIDTTGQNPPRFPESLAEPARDAIRDELQRLKDRTKGRIIAIASGAHGGDLLFHEVCEQLQLEHRLYLPLPAATFRNESVAPAGQAWEERFDSLRAKYDSIPILSDSEQLPTWLTTIKDYTPWQRANLWLIHGALAMEPVEFTLLSLWDGVETQGKGGTAHMRKVAQDYGASLTTIFLKKLVTAAQPPPKAVG